MAKLLFLSAFLFAVTPPQANAQTSFAAPPAANFILIGWDGAQRSRVQKMLAADKLPNLRTLAGEGSLVETKVVTGQTSTKPGWAEILTGYSAARLKIFSNSDYRPIPEGYTVFERLKARFGGGIATVFIAGKRYNLGARGPHKICANAHRRDPVTSRQTDSPDIARFKGATTDGRPPRWVPRAGEPYFNATKGLDLYSAADEPADGVGGRALAALRQYREKPFFAFIHFQEPDEQGHRYGENSPQYAQALSRTDRWLGEIVRELKRLDLYSRTVIFVTADHGFEEGKQVHKHAPLMTLATNCPKKIHSGDRKDITPTILAWYGFRPAEIKPALYGRSLLIE